MNWELNFQQSGRVQTREFNAGKFEVFVPQANSEIRADAVPFEVIDQDVTGLLVKTSQGASVSGVVVLEGTNDKSALANSVKRGFKRTSARCEGQVKQLGEASYVTDGSFRVRGLQVGLRIFRLARETAVR